MPRRPLVGAKMFFCFIAAGLVDLKATVSTIVALVFSNVWMVQTVYLR